jgi:hypothetical protein
MPNHDDDRKAGSEAALLDGLIPVDVPVTLALARLLEPGDRRFMALGWANGLCVYDGWTEYTLGDLSLKDLFGSRGMSAVLRAGNAYHGCERTHILIDFAQGIIYTGDEACVERILDEVVDEQYHRSLLAATLGSLAVRLPLDGNCREAF